MPASVNFCLIYKIQFKKKKILLQNILSVNYIYIYIYIYIYNFKIKLEKRKKIVAENESEKSESEYIYNFFKKLLKTE